MEINVIYTTQLKAALRQSCETITLEAPCTLGKLVEALRMRHGPAFSDLALQPSGQLLPSILLCIGDKQTEFDQNRQLKNGDAVTFLSAISGG